MKTRALIGLILLFAAQLAVPFYMIHHREKTLRQGEQFRFLTRPIDPADPFQGRYVRLGFKNDYIPCSKEEIPDLKYKEPVFVLLETGPDGFAVLSDWTRERPTEGAYLKTRYMGPRRQWNSDTSESIHMGLRFDLPFNRFYMDEAKAPLAERAVRASEDQTNCWASVRIRDGHAVLEDVFAEGQSLREIAAEKE